MTYFVTAAYADGVTDDSANIQAAIDLVYNQGGGKVFLPAGNYAYRNTIYLRSNVILEGDGYATTLLPVSGLNTTLGDGIFTTIAAVSRFYYNTPSQPSRIAMRNVQSQYQGPHQNIGIKNLRIIGTSQGLSGDGACAVELMDFTYANLENLIISNGYDVGIRIEGAGAVNPVWTNFDNYTGGYASRFWIEKCRITGCKHGIEVGEQATYGWISDNFLASNLQHGIRLTGGYITKIYGNHVAGTVNGSNAIQLSRSQDVDVFDNSIDPANGWTTVEECVKLMELRRCKIHDNRFYKGGIVTQSGMIPNNVMIYNNDYTNETSRSSLVNLGGSVYCYVRERVPTNNQLNSFTFISIG